MTKHLGDGGSHTYYTYELKNVIITSYNIGTNGQSDLTPSGLPRVSGGGLGGVPMEEISLNFEEIKVAYTEVDDAGQAAGKVEYSWKVEEGSR